MSPASIANPDLEAVGTASVDNEVQAPGNTDDEVQTEGSDMRATGSSDDELRDSDDEEAHGPKRARVLELMPEQLPLGQRVRVWWRSDGVEYDGYVAERHEEMAPNNARSLKVRVQYDDGDLAWHHLHDTRIKLLESRDDDDDTACLVTSTQPARGVKRKAPRAKAVDAYRRNMKKACVISIYMQRLAKKGRCKQKHQRQHRHETQTTEPEQGSVS